MIHRLRPASSSDFDWLLALARGDGLDPAERRARFTRAFASQAWWVVEVEREPVGALSVAWEEDPVVLHEVAIAPAWQGRGLGTRLVHDVLASALGLGRAVEAELPSGDPARALLERLAFRPVAGEPTGAPAHVRLRWQADARTDATLAAAMSPWLDVTRRRAWVRRLFEAAPDDAVGFCRFAARRHGVPDDAEVLVVGCGTGRLLRPLAELGLRVTGDEPDADYRAAAARVAARAGGVIDVRDRGLLELEDCAARDVVVALDGVLWTLTTHAQRVEAVRRMARALRPGGVLLLEGPNFPWILKAYREPPAVTEVYHRASVSRIPAHALDFHDGVLEHRDAFVVDVEGEASVEWTETRRFALLGLPLVRLALEQAGVEVVETFRDLRANGAGRVTGGRIVLVARGVG